MGRLYLCAGLKSFYRPSLKNICFFCPVFTFSDRTKEFFSHLHMVTVVLIVTRLMLGKCVGCCKSHSLIKKMKEKKVPGAFSLNPDSLYRFCGFDFC